MKLTGREFEDLWELEMGCNGFWRKERMAEYNKTLALRLRMVSMMYLWKEGRVTNNWSDLLSFFVRPINEMLKRAPGNRFMSRAKFLVGISSASSVCILTISLRAAVGWIYNDEWWRKIKKLYDVRPCTNVETVRFTVLRSSTIAKDCQWMAFNGKKNQEL